jgi:hypothetical protein
MAHRIWSWFQPKTEADIVGMSSDASTSVCIVPAARTIAMAWLLRSCYAARGHQSLHPNLISSVGDAACEDAEGVRRHHHVLVQQHREVVSAATGCWASNGVKHDQLPPNTNGLVSDLFFGIVNQYLAGSISVVIEAAFQHKVWEPRMPKILELASPLIVLCCADGAVAARRHLQRGLENPNRGFYHGDKRVAHYRKTGEISPPDSFTAPKFKVPTIQVSTDGEYIPCIDEIVKQIQSSDAQQGGAPDALAGAGDL